LGLAVLGLCLGNERCIRGWVAARVAQGVNRLFELCTYGIGGGSKLALQLFCSSPKCGHVRPMTPLTRCFHMF
jgi:hypothetical protein